MTHASLFSGIGGFDLAAQWAGWENAFWCEKDPFCQTVLKYHFPNSIGYDDITTTDFKKWGGRIDVVSGGFPCQPFSQAGKRLGTEDERHLWPEMLRAIREIRPRWVVGENVRGILNWNDGMVFEQVCADLETEGYEITPLLLPACGVGAHHERYRVWFVAHRNSIGLHTPPLHDGANREIDIPMQSTFATLATIQAVRSGSEPGKYGVVNGLPATLDECRLHALGNAVVPQEPLQIFRAINELEKL